MPAHENVLGSEATTLNRLSVMSLVFAVMAVAGLWFFTTSGLAIFAVGAGHVALNRIAHSGQRGRWLAISALIVGYGIGLLGLFATLAAIPAMIQSYAS
ncbi:DUF4190 domain-containing protein [Glutamicibacter arilaitensis]|uniref:DUF4190 domain-containing protein n=1 Tax=Glutamicibacter arilaitensis TaxID=256701 RepID=UPI003FD0163C